MSTNVLLAGGRLRVAVPGPGQKQSGNVYVSLGDVTAPDGNALFSLTLTLSKEDQFRLRELLDEAAEVRKEEAGRRR